MIRALLCWLGLSSSIVLGVQAPTIVATGSDVAKPPHRTVTVRHTVVTKKPTTMTTGTTTTTKPYRPQPATPPKRPNFRVAPTKQQLAAYYKAAREHLERAGLEDVQRCIKNHESGNYSEHSHISDGSGAYQYIPKTWRYYATLAGHAGYSYAYQAPPDVQDAVFFYTLTHGGAHNWDPKFGNDPCTVNLP